MNTRHKSALLPISTFLGLALLAARGAAQTPTGSFYLAAQGTTTPITSLTTTGPGDIINLSVFFQINQAGTTFDPNSINVLLGFDQTTTEGTSATPLDNRLVLNGTTSTAITNVNGSFGSNPASNSSFGALGGGQPTTAGAMRPYGADLFFNTGGGGESPVPTTATRLFDISLKNSSLSSGSEAVTVYNGGSGGDFTTYLTDGTTTIRPAMYTLTVSAAPEPAQSVPMGLLVLGVGGLLLRARKRRKTGTL